MRSKERHHSPDAKAPLNAARRIGDALGRQAGRVPQPHGYGRGSFGAARL